MRRVRAILRHLVRYVAGVEVANNAADEEDFQPSTTTRTRHTSLTRTISVTSDDGNFCDISEQEEEGEVGPIPPLMFTALYAADKDERGKIIDGIIQG